MDPDLAEFTDTAPGPKGCVVGRALADLPTGDADKLRKALAADRVKHSQIERWLRSRGIRPYVSAVSRHRNGGCRCEEHGYV